MLYRWGVWHIRNSLINEGAFEGNALTVNGGQNNSLADVAGSTLNMGKYNVIAGSLWSLGGGGWNNVMFAGAMGYPSPTSVNPVNTQPLKAYFSHNVFFSYMGTALISRRRSCRDWPR